MLPLARGRSGLIIMDIAGDVVVATYDEGRAGGKYSVSSSKFVSLTGTPVVLPASEAEKYIDILREAVRAVEKASVDIIR